MQNIAELPKYALETIIFGGILLIILYFIGIKKNISGILPLISLYAFAGYRLMPAFQRIFSGFTSLRFHMPVIDTIYNDLYEINNFQKKTSILHQEDFHLNFNESIVLHDITYKYPQSRLEIIKKLDLTIYANTTVGFVGETGSGKTTLIDIILGLLSLYEGEILIDGIPLTRTNIRTWQNNIGYVPQQIYLADDSISNNIAFGIHPNDVDHQSVTKAAKIAKIHDFILNNLQNGYETKIGERGVRLSGGQRQRIGLARALYHDPKVLVLDEATSALDGSTEKEIMDAIYNLSREKTIILIAHRITTVKECDTIFVMENGKIVANGNYDKLITSSEQFRAIAKSSDSPSATPN
jgi:ABC-type multidrug transport system fused ATPase/permease subunit